MLPVNTAAKTTGPLLNPATAAALVPTPEAKAAPPAPPAPPETAAPQLTKDATALATGKGTSKLKLDMPKQKPQIDTTGDDKWQTDQAKKDLHLNQRDLFSNLLDQVRGPGADLPNAKELEKQVIGLQEAFNKAEDGGDYKAAGRIHKEMQKLSHEILDAIKAE